MGGNRDMIADIMQGGQDLIVGGLYFITVMVIVTIIICRTGGGNNKD